MTNNKLKNLVFLAVILSSLALAGLASASEITGTLNTNSGSSISGTVVVPPPPAVGGGGGGGGGGGNGLIVTQKNGDIDHDGKIDIRDFNLLMVNWGKSGYGIQGDLSNDGKVDLSDFNILMVNWGK